MNLLRRASALVLILIPAVLAAAAPPAPSAEKAPAQETPRAAAPKQTASAPRVDFEKYTLPNGLSVILHVDFARRTAARSLPSVRFF